MRRLVLVVVALGTLVTPIVLAQVGGAQAGTQKPQAQSQAPNTPPKTTGLILGQVVDGSTGQPIADAIVTLTQMGGGGRGANPMSALPVGGSPQQQQAMEAAMAAAANLAGRGAAGPQRVMTGADGRFVFGSLPPASFQVSVSLTGYTATLSASAGASGGGLAALAGLMGGGGAGSSAPTSLALKEGEHATGLKMRLWKHAVVSGTVLDDAGEPAIGVRVQVARRMMAAGRARYVPGTAATTDDRGVYRVGGLIPGSYIVVVPQTQVAIPTAVLGGIIDSVTGAGPGGGGMALLDVMSSGIDFSSSLQGGVRMGDYMVASSGSVPLVGADGHLQAFQTVFYPGAFAPAQASVVSLASGEERTEINFQLRLVSMARVSGTALGPDGPVGNLGVRLVVPGDGNVGESEIDVANSVTKADGTFSFFGVPPGQFLLKAVKQPRIEVPMEMLAANPTLQAMFAPGGDKGTKETLYAATSISVAGSDMDGIALTLATGFRVSGRLEFESVAGKAQPTAQQLQGVVVMLTPMDGRSQGGLLGLGDLTNPDRANAQGEFRTKGFAPGKYFMNAAAPAGWQLKSATIGGRDVLDAPIDIHDADVGGIVVTFTDKLGQVTGTVQAPGETDLSEVSVLLVPANYRAWIDNGMNPRRSRTTRASRSGAYTVPNLPAGEYLAVAIDRAREGDMQDPAYIEALARAGTRVTVNADPVSLALTRTQVVVK